MRQSALNEAIKNIDKYKLNNKITAFTHDGIKQELLTEVNTIMLSGLGANTIIDILKDKVTHYRGAIITSAQKNNHLLRKFMLDNNYQIQSEDIILERGKYYNTIKFMPGKYKYKKRELYQGIKVADSNEANNYYHYMYQKYKTNYQKIPWRKLRKKILYKRLLNYFRQI